MLYACYLIFSYMISKENGDVLSAVQVLVQHLCTKCPERAEYRSIVAKVRGDSSQTEDTILSESKWNFLGFLCYKRITGGMVCKVRETWIKLAKRILQEMREIQLIIHSVDLSSVCLPNVVVGR